MVMQIKLVVIAVDGCLPKFCICNFSSEDCNTQKKFSKNKGYVKFWEANKVYYGRCANSELIVAKSADNCPCMTS